MNESDLETRLRGVLRERADTIRPSDLSDDFSARRLSPEAPVPDRRRTRRLLAAAAAVAMVTAAAAVTISRDEEQAVRAGVAQQPPQGGSPAGAPADAFPWPVWPVLDGSALPGSVPRESLGSPERATNAFLTAVADLPEDWPLGQTATDGDRAVVRYVLQDVPSEARLARDPGGLWFVIGATTQQFGLGNPVVMPGGVDLAVSAASRSPESGGVVRLTAVAADGSVLARRAAVIPPPAETGTAGSARVTALRWSGSEVPAAVRADATSDHDDNSATPDVVVGHASIAVPGFVPAGLPVAFSLRGSLPVFSAAGSPDAVGRDYFRARFPDLPAPGVRLFPPRTRGREAAVVWTTGSDSEGTIAQGEIYFRRDGDSWVVVVATTSDVDLSQVERTSSRIRGTVRTTNQNTLSVDVLRPDGSPVAGAPHPEGQEGGKPHRYGTAGRGEKQVSFDLAVEDEPVTVRAQLVGGTLLSISEFVVDPPA